MLSKLKKETRKVDELFQGSLKQRVFFLTCDDFKSDTVTQVLRKAKAGCHTKYAQVFRITDKPEIRQENSTSRESLAIKTAMEPALCSVSFGFNGESMSCPKDFTRNSLIFVTTMVSA